MTQKINFPNPKPPIEFGDRVSRSHPTFTLGGIEFQTRLIGLKEDRALTKQQARFPKAEAQEDGSEGELTEAQQDETLQIMCEVVADLVRRRVVSSADREAITPEWALEHMTSDDFAPLMFFLRKGYPMEPAENIELNDVGDDNPNAEA